MNEIMYKATSQGGIITTAELPNQSDYQKIVRAKERGELIRVRHGVYAVPDALFNTILNESFPMELYACTTLGHIIRSPLLFHLPFVLP